MSIFDRISKKQSVEVTVSNRTVIRILGLTLITYFAVLAFRQARHPLTLLFIAFFLSLALNAPVHWIASHLPGRSRGSRSLATTTSFLLVLALFGLFFASIVPPLVRQTSNLIDAAPGLIEDVRSEDSSVGRFVRKYHLEDQVDKLSDQVSGWARSLTSSAVGTAGRVTSSVVSVLTVLVLTFMMLIEGPRWLNFARRLIPDDKEDHAAKLVQDMYKVIKGYVNGQVLLAAIAAILIAPPLFILHVNYPFALMVVIFICGLIPLVGHTIGSVLVSFVALFTSPLAALIIFLYYITYQQIENYTVQPRIQANSTDMSPLLVFASVIIGVSFNGLLGGLVAIPVAGCARILVLDYLRRKKLLEPYEEAALAKAEA
jgi:predicted PurR-regulated permease PerM